MSKLTDVVEFRIANGYYAIDVQIAREIVEMMAITPIPRAPDYITGVINLRGEVTNIINLSRLIGLPESEASDSQKIIVLMPDASQGSNVGIIVDDVNSVMQVEEKDVEALGEGLSSDVTEYVKGIIKVKEDASDAMRLIIWVDMHKVLSQIIA
ncbi:chemotaxis protein CheW [Methanogenium organophilum]|uniref:Chemotaxis protein CheW n=1 Tax=Methanogenium organophilum TaxID=2199 RepID=A0A9X9T8T1_METOG|nr:chemotaxis protein CheW [Methanogenium organophilum]WAI02499.1 chemotaxis protein CheW [Methanogenium organophilum]